MKYYAGIGPRQTPKEVQNILTDIARQLVPAGWGLRSGNAKGADQAFQRGAVNKNIFLPWNGFNGAYTDHDQFVWLPPSTQQDEIAASHHPAWHNCSSAAQLLLARNVPIILGENLDDPVECVITWLPEPNYRGGTTHALRIASTYGVPVFNMQCREDQNAMCRFILNVENRAQTPRKGTQP